MLFYTMRSTLLFHDFAIIKINISNKNINFSADSPHNVILQLQVDKCSDVNTNLIFA